MASRSSQLRLGDELEQALVDHGDRDLAAGRRRRAVGVAHRDLHGRLLAHAIASDGRSRRARRARARCQPTSISAMPSGTSAGRDRPAPSAARRRRGRAPRAPRRRRSAPTRASTGTSITGSAPERCTTRASPTPSRSIVTSAVASRNGMRTWKPRGLAGLVAPALGQDVDAIAVVGREPAVARRAPPRRRRWPTAACPCGSVHGRLEHDVALRRRAGRCSAKRPQRVGRRPRQSSPARRTSVVCS